MKIWFQNRRTKWKKQDNISNAEAAEHKIQTGTGKDGMLLNSGKQTEDPCEIKLKEFPKKISDTTNAKTETDSAVKTLESAKDPSLNVLKDSHSFKSLPASEPSGNKLIPINSKDVLKKLPLNERDKP